MARKPPTSPRKTPKQARSRFLVDAILEATARVLVGHGYDDATTTKVAEAAGVSIGSLYQYFPGREALVAALIDRHLEAITDRIDALTAEAGRVPLAELLRRVARAHLALHAADAALHRALLEKVPALERTAATVELRSGIAARTRAILELHRDALAVRDLDLAAFVVVNLVDGLVQAAILDRPELLAKETYADEIAAAAARYLGLPPE